MNLMPETLSVTQRTVERDLAILQKIGIIRPKCNKVTTLSNLRDKQTCLNTKAKETEIKKG